MLAKYKENPQKNAFCGENRQVWLVRTRQELQAGDQAYVVIDEPVKALLDDGSEIEVSFGELVSIEEIVPNYVPLVFRVDTPCLILKRADFWLVCTEIYPSKRSSMTADNPDPRQ